MTVVQEIPFKQPSHYYTQLGTHTWQCLFDTHSSQIHAHHRYAYIALKPCEQWVWKQGFWIDGPQRSQADQNPLRTLRELSLIHI